MNLKEEFTKVFEAYFGWVEMDLHYFDVA